MTVKLIPEVKKVWVDALRSGRYQQAYQDLIGKDGGHCCLGVLIAELGCKIEKSCAGVPYSVVTAPGKDPVDSDGAIPPAIFHMIYPNSDGWPNEQAGINPRVEVVLDEDGQTHGVMLSELNDDYGWTFEQIADVIEEQL